MPPKIFAVESRKSIELDASLFLGEGEFNLARNVEERGLAFIQLRRNKAIVSAGAYVGLIPLNSSVYIDVRPKMPVSNLARVLDISVRRLTVLDDATRDYKSDDAQSNPVLIFAAENLARNVRKAQTSGFLKRYEWAHLMSSSPRGRIDVRQTVAARQVRAKPQNVAHSSFEQTANNAENRIVKAGLAKAQHLLRSAGDASAPVRAIVGEALRTVPTSVGPLRPGDGRLSTFSSRSLPESLAFYADAVSYASLILHGSGISLDDSGDEHELDGFIVNFETMFEDYVRNSISLHASADWRIEDGNTVGRRPLFDDRPSPPAQPDIVISNSAIRLVVEVKYKEKPDRADINQALTYALSYGTRVAIILHLSGVGSHAGAYLIGRVGTISLYGYRLDLGVATMQQQEKQLADDLFALAQGPS